ncbi:MAG: NAD/NADP octopine/nopaline dehydrogenase family protein, partial [Peptostreptococcaceae bacterium]
IGAGNIGTYLAAYISMKKDCKVWVHTSKPHLFKDELILVEEEKNLEHKIKLHCATSNIEECVKDADYILITHPSFLIEKTLNEITPYVKTKVCIGLIPGFGGKEYLSQELINKGCIIFGTQRVPSIIRLEKYGEKVLLKEKNPFMKLGTIPSSYNNEVCEVMTNLIDIPCEPVDNYISITLSPSNPIMHPSRLYELFKDYKHGETIYDKNPLFYEEWGDEASKTLFELDEELGLVFESLNEFNDFNTGDIEKIKERFKTEDPKVLSEKINTAPGFKDIDSPMEECENGFIPELKSRYFIEDLEFGLCIIKSFAEICNLNTPKLDEVIYWAQNLLNKEYLIKGEIKGRDSKELLIPQNRGIKSKQELINFYKNL